MQILIAMTLSELQWKQTYAMHFCFNEVMSKNSTLNQWWRLTCKRSGFENVLVHFIADYYISVQICQHNFQCFIWIFILQWTQNWKAMDVQGLWKVSSCYAGYVQGKTIWARRPSNETFSSKVRVIRVDILNYDKRCKFYEL